MFDVNLKKCKSIILNQADRTCHGSNSSPISVGALEHVTPEGSSRDLTVTSLEISHTVCRQEGVILQARKFWMLEVTPPRHLLSTGNGKTRLNVNQSWRETLLSYLQMLCDTVNSCDTQWRWGDINVLLALFPLSSFTAAVKPPTVYCSEVSIHLPVFRFITDLFCRGFFVWVDSTLSPTEDLLHPRGLHKRTINPLFNHLYLPWLRLSLVTLPLSSNYLSCFPL